jgi:hypothetical protein
MLQAWRSSPPSARWDTRLKEDSRKCLLVLLALPALFAHLRGTGVYDMEHYLIELDEHQLERLTGMVREAIEVASKKEVHELEALLSALGNVRWKAGDRTTD